MWQLNRKTDRDKLVQLARNGECDYGELMDVSNIHQFIKTGESPLAYGKHPVVTLEHEPLLVCDGLFVPPVDIFNVEHMTTCKVAKDVVPVAVIPSEVKRIKPDNLKQEVFILLNGDQNEWSPRRPLQGEIFDAFPTISLYVVGQLFGCKTAIATGKMFTNGSLKIMDYTLDQTKPMTAAQKRSRKECKPFKGPLGFTLVDRKRQVWHRAGAVLFRDVRDKSGATYLLAADEGTYFGCQLPGHPQTVDDAYKSLIPPIVQKAAWSERQGEWFAIPAKKSEVPAKDEAIALFDINGTGLPIDHPESNIHWVASDDGRISKNGTFYATEEVGVSHDEHEQMSIQLHGKWVKFVHNRAVRSVSVGNGGVD